MLSVNNLVRPPKRASVDGDGPQLLLRLQDLFGQQKPTIYQENDTFFFASLGSPRDPVSPKYCILDYLAGNVARTFATNSCPSCLETLISSSRQSGDLIYVNSKGCLQLPSRRLFSLLKIVEEFTLDRIASADV
ncbi:unnamed protein product [Ixodes pacificus]